MIQRICLFCSKEFEVWPYKIKDGRGLYCSRVCKDTAFTGQPNTKISKENHYSWKGGIRLDKGYRTISTPNHPNANNCGYVQEHRLVVEKSIGRFLDPMEVVHHLDGDRSNNKLSNLLLVENKKEHIKYHRNMYNGQTLMLGG